MQGSESPEERDGCDGSHRHIDRRTPTILPQSVDYSKKCSTYWLSQIDDLLCWLYRHNGEIWIFVDERSYTCKQKWYEPLNQLVMSVSDADSLFLQLAYPLLSAILTSVCFPWLIRPMCDIEPYLTLTVQSVQNNFVLFLWGRLSQGLSVPMLQSCAKAFCEWISYH